MSELNITELLNQKVLEFGNERFLEGWNGQQERIINLLDSMACDNIFCRKVRLMYSHTGCKAIRLHIAAIKGENN